MIPRLEHNEMEDTVTFRDRYSMLDPIRTYVEAAGFNPSLAISSGGMSPASAPAHLVLTKEAYDWLLKTSPEKVSPYLPATHPKKVKASPSAFTIGGTVN
jgi:hypothetical protein